MPHSAGGGSHGGGGHSGGYHGGGSGNRISTHYFAGARRFRRHYTDGRPDEYVYATGKPAKAGLSSVIILCVVAVFFMFSAMFGIVGNVPNKLKTKYWDAPRVYDDVDLIANDEELESILMEYCDTTGICPVIYTTFNEEWEYNEGDYSSYADLESYAFDKYVTNFSDEQHLVIVYSVPMDDAIALYNGEKFVPDYQWEAIQGDETDPIITEMLFRKFTERVQDKLEAGEDPGEAFGFAFKKLKTDSESIIKPGGTSWMLKLFTSFFPMLVVSGIFVPMIVVTIRRYRKDKDAEYEEVPLDRDPVSVNTKNGTVGGMSAGAFTTTYSQNGSSTYKTVTYDPQKGGSKLTSVLSLVFLIPFFIVGIVTIVAGIGMLKSNSGTNMGGFILAFGIVWMIILVATCGKFIKTIVGIKKKEDEPVSVSYPKTEYPEPVMPGQDLSSDQNVQVFKPAKHADNTEFDPQFFSSSSSSYEDDDEEYKRMKRRGFE